MDPKKELNANNNNIIYTQEINQEITEKLSVLYPLLLSSSDERKPTIVEADGNNKIIYIYQFMKETGEFIVIKKKFKDSDELQKILEFICS
jgi:hypothetical protein